MNFQQGTANSKCAAALSVEFNTAESAVMRKLLFLLLAVPLFAQSPCANLDPSTFQYIGLHDGCEISGHRKPTRTGWATRADRTTGNHPDKMGMMARREQSDHKALKVFQDHKAL